MDGEKVTTIGIRNVTKDRLDKNRAPGQSYNGFIWQLVDLWEQANELGLLKQGKLIQKNDSDLINSPK